MAARGNKQQCDTETTTKTANAQKGVNDACEYHAKPLLAYCVVHEELVCEDCTDSEFHKTHNDQILLLKAAAQNLCSKLSNMTNEIFASNEFL